jgi:hypothetical protein
MEGWKRRQAIQLASQLPEDPQDALRVLELTRELVLGFLVPVPSTANVAAPTGGGGRVLKLVPERDS